MSTIFTQPLVGIAASRLVPRKIWSKRFLMMSLVAAIIPDIDVIGIPFGVPHGHALAHRGLTHSIIFTIPISLLLLKIFFSHQKIISLKGLLMTMYLVLVTLSHGILDALGDGTNGVALLWPFTSERIFLPVNPIPDSVISTSFFGEIGYRVMLHEILIIWVPLSVLVILNESRIWLGKRKK